MNYKKLLGIAGSVCILSTSLCAPCHFTAANVNAATQQIASGIDANVTTEVNNSINLKFTIKPSTTAIDLSKLKLNFFFDTANARDMKAYCDNAAMQLNVAPYYVDLTSKVAANVTSSSLSAGEPSMVLNVNFNSDQILQPGQGSITLTMRIANGDWSSITSITNTKLTVTYDGSTETPVISEKPVVSEQPVVSWQPAQSQSPVVSQDPVVSNPPTPSYIPVSDINTKPVNYSDMPSDITRFQAGVNYGTTKKISYYSKVTGSYKNCNVITPANYSPSKKYPVLYLLHGIGGNEDEWMNGGCATVIGNMIANGYAKEMIVVVPNARANKGNDVPNDWNENIATFDKFIDVVKTDLVPYINSNYSTKTGPENTAIAGLSMGGRESLFIGISMTDTFGYIGAFSPAPGLLPDAGLNYGGQFKPSEFKIPAGKPNPKMIMICNGTSDSVVHDVPTYYHNTLASNGVQHVWYTMPGDHNFEVWLNGLYHFSERLF